MRPGTEVAVRLDRAFEHPLDGGPVRLDELLQLLPVPLLALVEQPGLRRLSSRGSAVSRSMGHSIHEVNRESSSHSGHSAACSGTVRQKPEKAFSRSCSTNCSVRASGLPEPSDRLRQVELLDAAKHVSRPHETMLRRVNHQQVWEPSLSQSVGLDDFKCRRHRRCKSPLIARRAGARLRMRTAVRKSSKYWLIVVPSAQ